MAFGIQPTGWDIIKPRLLLHYHEAPATNSLIALGCWGIIQGEASITLCTHHSLRFSSPDSFCLSRREELPSRGYSPNGILVHSVYSRLAYGDCISYLGRQTYLMLNCSIWNHGRTSSFQYEYLNSGRFCWHKMIAQCNFGKLIHSSMKFVSLRRFEMVRCMTYVSLSLT